MNYAWTVFVIGIIFTMLGQVRSPPMNVDIMCFPWLMSQAAKSDTAFLLWKL